MATITTRAGKGSPLTNTEVDNNFTNINTELGQKESASNKGVANGYASLDGSGKVPSTQLPSYVDDVVEGANLAALPATGETGKIYVTLDTNKTYRWSGSAYVEISASPGSTDAVTEGSTNLYFTNARARSAVSASGSLSYSTSTGVFSYTQPTNVSAFTNDSGYITSSALSSYLPLSGGTLTGALRVQGLGTSNPTTADGTDNSILSLRATDALVRLQFGTRNTGNYAGWIQASYDNGGGANGIEPLELNPLGGTVNANGNAVLHAGNYSSYALPLSGGTVSGVTTFTSSNDAQITLSGGSTTWAGITWADVNGSDYSWFYGATGTWAFGGGGSAVSGKKMHVHGGMTIGSGYAGTSNPSNGLNVEGAIQQAGSQVLHAGNYSSYALPLSGGTLTGGELRINSDWGAGSFTEQFLIYGTYPSMTFRSTTSDTGWLIHTQGDGGLTYYSIAGASTDNWTQRMTLLTNGELRKGGTSGDLYIHSGNYSSYALPLSGGTISGTVSINGGGSQPLNVTTSSSGPWGFGLTRSDAGVSSRVFLHNGSGSWAWVYEHNPVFYNGGAYSAFLNSSNYSSYAMPLSGGTITGALTVNGTIAGGGRVLAYSTTISMSGLDSNTYYPVTIPLPASRTTRLRIQNALNSNVPSWSTHGSGFSCYIEWITNGSGWGTIPVHRRINDWRESFSNVTIVGGITQLGNSSQEVIWLRGGGNYYFSADCDVVPTIRTGYYEIYGQSVNTSAVVMNNPYDQAGGRMSYGTFHATSSMLVGSNTVLHAGNYTSYSPSLTGSGASGTWGINVTGGANVLFLQSLGSGSVNVNQGSTTVYRTDTGNGSAVNYAPVLHVGGGDTMWQAQGTYGTSGNGTLYFRQGYSGSWGNWLTMLSSANYNSYSPTLTGGGASGTWSINITGNSGTVGGLSVHGGTNNEANKIVRTDGNGYIQAGWINTISGNLGSGSRLNRVWCSDDQYMRYLSLAEFKMQMGLSAKNTFQRHADYTGDSNYWVGSFGGSGLGANEVFHGGSGFVDFWGGTNFPPSTSHVMGFNALHYTTNSFGSTGGNAYGIQVVGQYDQGGLLFSRACSGGSFSAWRRQLDDNNYSSYALPLSGGTTTGRITMPAWTTSGRNYSNEWIEFGNYSGLYSPLNGAHFYPNNTEYGSWRIAGSRAGWHGIYFDSGANLMMNSSEVGFHRAGYGWMMWWSGGTGYVHKGNPGGGTQATILDSSNYTSYSPSLGGSGASGSWNITAARATRANGNFYIDDNYGNGVVGVYASTRYQGVFFMGDSYKMSADGTSLANMYGIGWSHPNAGGAAGNLTDHGMLIINNGSFRCAISNSIVASGNITAYSDERLKKNWRDMPDSFVERLAQVRNGCYERIDDGVQQVGVSAQSLQPLLPEAIQVSNDEMKTLSVSYGNAALAAAVELAKEIVAIKRELEALKARLH